MDEIRKSAYRYLLYCAMLDIRAIQWIRPPRLFNPLTFGSELRRVRRAGAIADWLHNLAMYSSRDFEGFNEEWFWKDFDRFKQRYGDEDWDYRAKFNDRLSETSPPAPTTSID